MSSGHYYAYVRSCAGMWARMDDCSVSKVRWPLSSWLMRNVLLPVVAGVVVVVASCWVSRLVGLVQQ